MKRNFEFVIMARRLTLVWALCWTCSGRAESEIRHLCPNVGTTNIVTTPEGLASEICRFNSHANSSVVTLAHNILDELKTIRQIEAWEYNKELNDSLKSLAAKLNENPPPKPHVVSSPLGDRI